MTETLTISPKEAAARLGLGRGTVYRLLWTGRLPAVKVGKRPHYRVPVRAIEEVLPVSEATYAPGVLAVPTVRVHGEFDLTGSVTGGIGPTPALWLVVFAGLVVFAVLLLGWRKRGRRGPGRRTKRKRYAPGPRLPPTTVCRPWRTSRRESRTAQPSCGAGACLPPRLIPVKSLSPRLNSNL
jgi:excisionase family DNA binding protein